MGSLDEALDYFIKLYDMLPEHAEVVYQMATLYEELEDLEQVCLACFILAAALNTGCCRLLNGMIPLLDWFELTPTPFDTTASYTTRWKTRARRSSITLRLRPRL